MKRTQANRGAAVIARARVVIVAFTVATTGMLSACIDQGPDHVAGPLVANAVTPKGKQAGSRPPNLHDIFVEIDRAAPGFGGLYYDGNDVVVNLVDLGRSEQARAKVRELLASRPRHARSGPPQIHFKKVNYGYGQLKTWYDKLDPIWQVDGVVYTDISDSRNRIVVGVTRSGLAGPIATALHELGLPSGAFEIVVTDYPVAALAELTDSVRPVMGGFQIWPSGCSNALSVRRPGISNLYLLTASHCTNNQGVFDAGAWTQGYPGLAPVGYEAADSPIFYCSTDALCQLADAALLVYDWQPDGAFGKIAKPTGLGLAPVDEQNPLTVIGEVLWPIEGEYVEKLGWRTGYSWGDIMLACVNVRVYNPSNGHYWREDCSAKAAYASQPGDSGSAIFVSGWPWNPATTEAAFYGVHFAGGSGGWFSPLGQIESVFGDLITH
jgi:hypothetical protein